MKIKTFPYDNFALDDPRAALVRSLRSLYLGQFLSLDRGAVSLRRDGELLYAEGAAAAWLLLDQEAAADQAPADESRFRALHEAIYAQYADIGAVVSGWPPHAMALVERGLSLGAPTSMMRKRNVLDPDKHIYPAETALSPNLEGLLAAARAKTDADDMGHMLMVVRGTGVVCGAPNLPEAMAHYQNVELLARLEVARLTTKG
jgi:ribulose-5-phosphate 4-epimerase/fuculose-1-phosphate aldolase